MGLQTVLGLLFQEKFSEMVALVEDFDLDFDFVVLILVFSKNFEAIVDSGLLLGWDSFGCVIKRKGFHISFIGVSEWDLVFGGIWRDLKELLGGLLVLGGRGGLFVS